MSQVYLVTAGEYSHYRVVEVFAKQEDAESFAAAFTEGNGRTYSNSATVEPMPLLDQLPVAVVEHRASWTWYPDGGRPSYDIDDIALSSDYRYGPDAVAKVERVHPRESHSPYRDSYHLAATGSDFEAVVKSVADRRAQILSDAAIGVFPEFLRGIK